ncbi:MAG: SCO family protein [Acidobacteria bacterium]|nr:SCO family protein [Acidobacteriota bacterium]
MVQAAASEEKSCCAAPTETKDANYVRTLAQYQVPDVTLVTQEGERVSLSQLLDTDRPVLLDFVFTTCTTICPVLTAGFADLQRQLGPQAEDVLMVSVSIDPEHDTPEVMLEYLQRFEAGPNWTFLTGNRADIEKTMRAFDAYVANKMSHLPLTFLKAPGAEKWVRIHGLISTADFMKEFQQLAQN